MVTVYIGTMVCTYIRSQVLGHTDIQKVTLYDINACICRKEPMHIYDSYSSKCKVEYYTNILFCQQF